MFRLQRLNVIKIVATEQAKNKLISEGFELIGNITQSTGEKADTKANKPVEYKDMSFNDLKTLAKEKRIKVSNTMKKEDLIKSLQEIGD